jgi:hypothetical protein
MKRLGVLILSIALGVAQSTAVAQAANVSLPVYPGAVKSKNPALSVTANHCGHSVSNTVYTVDAGVKTVSDWYVAHVPGSAHVDFASSGGGTVVFAPSGAAVIAISGSIAKSAATGPVLLNLATYNPPLSSSERQMMQELIGGDSAAKQQASAAMKAKCGPNSTL